MKSQYINRKSAELEKLLSTIEAHGFYLTKIRWWEKYFKRKDIKLTLELVCYLTQKADMLLSSGDDRDLLLTSIMDNPQYSDSLKQFISETLCSKSASLLVEKETILNSICSYTSFQADDFYRRVAY